MWHLGTYEPDEALNALATFDEADASSAQALRMRAQAHHDRDAYDLAAETFQAALSADRNQLAGVADMYSSALYHLQRGADLASLAHELQELFPRVRGVFCGPAVPWSEHWLMLSPTRRRARACVRARVCMHIRSRRRGSSLATACPCKAKKRPPFAATSAPCNSIRPMRARTWYAAHGSTGTTGQVRTKSSMAQRPLAGGGMQLSGTEHLKHNDYERAMQCFRNAVRVDARNYLAWCDAGGGGRETIPRGTVGLGDWLRGGS